MQQQEPCQHPPSSLHIEPYVRQEAEFWPAVGRHVLAQATEDTVVVYQARRRSGPLLMLLLAPPQCWLPGWLQRVAPACMPKVSNGPQLLPPVQAYTPSIGVLAAGQGDFRGIPGFSETRMTWVKTNFLWMAFR